MKRRIFCAVMTVVLVLTMLPVIAAAEGAVEIAFTQRETKAGATQVQVGVDMNNNPGLVTATIPVTWDNDVLHLVDVIPSEDILSAGWIGMSMDEYQSNGTYYLAWDNDLAEADFTTEVGCLAELVFDIVDPSKDTNTTLAFDMDDPIANVMNFDMEDLRETVTVNAANGTVAVAAEAGGDDPVVDYEVIISTNVEKENVKVGTSITYSLAIEGTWDGFEVIIPDSDFYTVESVTTVEIAGSKANVDYYEANGEYVISIMPGCEQVDSERATVADIVINIPEDAELGEKEIDIISAIVTNDIGDKVANVGLEYATVNLIDFIPGDINGDEVIDYTDVTKLYAIYRGKATSDNELLIDVNKDGVFDYTDITKLYAYYRGKTTLPE